MWVILIIHYRSVITEFSLQSTIIFGASYLERHVTILDHDKTKDELFPLDQKT